MKCNVYGVSTAFYDFVYSVNINKYGAFEIISFSCVYKMYTLYTAVNIGLYTNVYKCIQMFTSVIRVLSGKKSSEFFMGESQGCGLFIYKNF